MSSDNKKIKDDIIKEVFRISNAEIRKTGVKQCETHRWRKLSDNELACTLCPTAIIVNNIEDYDYEHQDEQ
jgi:hypothetical protein